MNIDTRKLLREYVRAFNADDAETVKQLIPNAQAEGWLSERVPRVALPDAALERAYYFRWWTYRKHLKATPDGIVITEFHPAVPWAGLHNTIPCACGHHIQEGRWLRDNSFLDDYIAFWYGAGKAHAHSYSNWLEAAVLSLCEVRGDDGIGVRLLNDMAGAYERWDATNGADRGLYWSSDDRDGSEFSISGPGLRTTLNSYQVGNALAIARFAMSAGRKDLARDFDARARTLRDRINALLWDDGLEFYRTIAQRGPHERPFAAEDRRARELFGYIPWAFGVAPASRARAFRHLTEPDCFRGGYGLTTTDRSHPGYGIFYTGAELNAWLRARGEAEAGGKGHECLWNGPVWPFATSLALTALADALDAGMDCGLTRDDYAALLSQYAASHTRALPDGRRVSWIDENIHPDTGDWISRTRLMRWNPDGWSAEKGGPERGKDYNHSTFCNLVLEGLFGLRPKGGILRVAPLFPSAWKYAKLEGAFIHGHDVSVDYDASSGYRVSLDGVAAFSSDAPRPCEIRMEDPMRGR